MNFIADLHTHTVASGHAYSTILENVRYAQLQGFKAIAITDHTPALPHTTAWMHFVNMRVVPELIHNVRVLRGAETNILDHKGTLDLPSSESVLNSMDWVVASIHGVCYTGKTKEDNTNAYLTAVKNPYVDCIGHCGQPKFPFDHLAVVQACKEYDKVIELNEASFHVRAGSRENCYQIIELCKKLGVKIAVNSDAHIATAVGRFPMSEQMLRDLDFPEELVLNADYDRLMEHINRRRGIKF